MLALSAATDALQGIQKRNLNAQNVTRLASFREGQHHQCVRLSVYSHELNISSFGNLLPSTLTILNSSAIILLL